jgi:hypothetical protein
MSTYCISSCRHRLARIELRLIDEIDEFVHQNDRHLRSRAELKILFVVMPSENSDNFL